ncbi:MAG: hypothetical protein IVW55_18385, partial [Chloroflexi bacterium]|nr:hypothetical protein [Chloroflexota bacterium]
MSFSKGRFALFWAVLPTQADWDNLDASHVRLVMLTMQVAAHGDVLRGLQSRGIRVVLRLAQGSDTGKPPNVTLTAVRAVAAVVGVEAVIVGCEPDNGFRMDYGSPDWGQSAAYAEGRRVDELRRLLVWAGYRVVSSALTCREISETDVAPGLHTWREIVGPAYQQCDGCAWHLYMYDWAGVVDQIRAMFALSKAVGWWHKPIWIDEIGLPSTRLSDIEQMQAYIDVANMLLDSRRAWGTRIEMLCPFISAGDPRAGQAWDASLLLKDVEAYRLLGRWMT